jgi:hypothetical protein
MAQGDTYLECANTLKASLLSAMPNANVTIVTTDMLPHGDQAKDFEWKLSNDWQVYEASPYEYTIKLEADMYIPYDIDYWFDVLKDRDINVCTTIRNYKNQVSDSIYYRKFIVDNNLPDTYNAITYFRKSDKAEQFYKIVRNLFENWNTVKKTLQCNTDEPATTDWVYAIACNIMGIEETTMPEFKQFSMVHMKQFINNLQTEDWTDELVYEFTTPLRINMFTQQYPVHYHIKEFSKELRANYG